MAAYQSPTSNRLPVPHTAITVIKSIGINTDVEPVTVI